jgi:protein O-GlcNAc transferase
MTTTCASLWMGVPAVTWVGRSHVSRTTASFLTAVGLTDWIAATREDYAPLAVQKAGNVGELVRLRRELRNRMRQSPLGNPAEYTAALESAYEEMVQKHS